VGAPVPVRGPFASRGLWVLSAVAPLRLSPSSPLGHPRGVSGCVVVTGVMA